jgi:hypothetical protein
MPASRAFALSEFLETDVRFRSFRQLDVLVVSAPRFGTLIL